MSVEQENVEQEEIAEGIDNGDQDFDAGFEGKSTPTETPEAAEESHDEGAETDTKQQEAQPEPEHVQLTKDDYDKLMSSVTGMEEMRATLDKQFGTAFGKIGGIERFIKDLQQETPEGQALEITDEDFAELQEDFPELVGPQKAVLQRIASKFKGTGGDQQTEWNEDRIHEVLQPSLSQVGDTAVERAKMEMAQEALDETHEGWKDIIGLPDQDGNVPETEFRKWLATQDENYQKRVSSSFSPVVIGRAIDKFNEHQEALKEKADSDRRDRFEEAVTEPGDGGRPPGPDDDDAFEAGFNGR